MIRAQSIYAGLLTVTLGSLATANASAHNFKPHDAITRAATSAMHYWLEGGLGTAANFCPNAGELPQEANFWKFHDQVGTALTNLRKLKTGLNPVRFDTSRCNATATYSTGYYPEDNLDQMGKFRIQDFRYLVERNYTTGCKLTALHDERLTNESWRTLGSVLGTLAGDVDNRNRDTVLWIKPTNSLYFAMIKEPLAYGVTLAAAVLLVPFACLYSLISDGSCSDAAKWAHQYNPVDYAAGLIPGFEAPYLEGDFNGLWHFQQTGSSGSYLTSYNLPPGMDYIHAGPSGIPGAIDLAITAATTASGVSLDAGESNGVWDFGQFDESSRSWPMWQAQSLGLTEFTPVSKLGKYGVKSYKDSGHVTAEKLGYPLHAIADATFPQHIACTTGWGHRPLEDAISDMRVETLKYDTKTDKFVDNPAGTVTNCHRPVEIVLRAYEYWKRYDVGNGGHVSIQGIIEYLATDARNWVDSHEGVWSDSASDQWHLGGKSTAVQSYKDEDYDGHSMSLPAFTEALELASAGAALAYLVDAGLVAANVTADGSTQCPTGTSFVHGIGCLAQSGSSPVNELPVSTEVAPTSQTTTSPPACGVEGEPCLTHEDCCTVSCTAAGVCSGVLL